MSCSIVTNGLAFEACIGLTSSCTIARSVCNGGTNSTTNISTPFIVNFITKTITQSSPCSSSNSGIYVSHETTAAVSTAGHAKTHGKFFRNTNCRLDKTHFLHPRF